VLRHALVTIAACYLSTGAIIFGADSTITVNVGNVPGTSFDRKYLNFGQKIFEVGEDSTYGIVGWGLGTLLTTSYRKLIAELADGIKTQSPASVAEVADRWRYGFWVTYANEFAPFMRRAQDLEAKGVARTPDEEGERRSLMSTLAGGFCLGGWCPPDRTPNAYEITYDPISGVRPPQALNRGYAKFWGQPTVIGRLLYGVDEDLYADILRSGKWNGTPAELLDLVRNYMLGQASNLPLREAVDYVYTSIYTTITAMKFSHLSPVCGGPIEIAAITADRHFRWIRHKKLDAAINSQEAL
jgi:hypothetical protein